MLKYRPLIQNAIHPSELFTALEIETIKTAIVKWEKASPIPAQEGAVIVDLLRIAREHGYYKPTIMANGVISWEVVAVPTHYPKCVITSMVPCDVCGVNTHANHYPDTEPERLCDEHKDIKKNKVVPVHLKGIPKDRPKQTVWQREKQIAKLRRQAGEIAPNRR